MPVQKDCLTISIQGVVQGVGFRPFVYNLAREMHIRGVVSNTSEGVTISAEGEHLTLFIERIRKEAPSLAKITNIDISPAEYRDFPDFSIQGSSDAGSFTLLSPDISVCDACLKELFDGEDRRYLYPFINCTNCGPRYSITMAVPYDRRNTTMHAFKMCGPCASEYRNPEDRRFHAQPNACGRCGPKVTLFGKDGETASAVDHVTETISLLKQGMIIAVKGIGGFHIACDALNPGAVKRLREGKRKSNKPFALMAPDIETIREYCHVSGAEEELLLSPQRPVVLLRKKKEIKLPDAVAPKNASLGFMLPYTPLHYLLFRHPLQGAGLPDRPHFSALVMTSGNISEEPIIIDRGESVEKLSGIADAFLDHDRDIFMRIDDSVLRVMRSPQKAGGDCAATASFIRKSRGYAPEPIPLMDEGPDVLGCGADIKNTFALTRGRYVIVSQHIGDMENYETVRFFEETLGNLTSVYRAAPGAIAYDLHPGYLSSRWAIEQGKQKGLKLFGIQHHYAHIGSVIAEHGLKGKVIGVAFDGTGYGEDGTLWGGEFLIADSVGYRRAGNLKQVALPGAAMAVKEPWRVALSCLREAFGNDVMDCLEPAGFIEKYGRDAISDILRIAGNRTFSPLSSGAGRFFDAASALMGICDTNTFEGEASIALESYAVDDIDDDYPVDIHFGDTLEVDFSHAFLGIMGDLRRKIDRHVMATKFHNTAATAIIRVVLKLSMMNNIKTVALSGGVFQNLFLFNRVSDGLQAEGLAVYANEKVPCNDAGISLGQAYIAREWIKAGKG